MNKYISPILFGLLMGFLTAVTITAWKGVANFLFMIIPLAIFLLWVFSVDNFEKAFSVVIFYVAWCFSVVLVGGLLNQGISGTLNYFLVTSNLMTLAILGFIVIDAVLLFYNFRSINERLRVFYSLGITAILGVWLCPLLVETRL